MVQANGTLGSPFISEQLEFKDMRRNSRYAFNSWSFEIQHFVRYLVQPYKYSLKVKNYKLLIYLYALLEN